MVMAMVMVATPTRATAACSLWKEKRCAEDGVSGVEGRDRGKWWWRRGIACASVIFVSMRACVEFEVLRAVKFWRV